MDRKQRVEFLVDHVKNPRHRGVLDGADVVMPGGSPECGGSVTIYLKANGVGNIEEVSFTGEGDTLSMAGSSMILEKVNRENLTMDEVLALDYEDFVDTVGRDLVGSRTRNVTLGLSTLKAAIRKYQKNELHSSNESLAKTV